MHSEVKIVKKNGVAINDLYSISLPNLETWQRKKRMCISMRWAGENRPKPLPRRFWNSLRRISSGSVGEKMNLPGEVVPGIGAIGAGFHQGC